MSAFETTRRAMLGVALALTVAAAVAGVTIATASGLSARIEAFGRETDPHERGRLEGPATNISIRLASASGSS